MLSTNNLTKKQKDLEEKRARLHELKQLKLTRQKCLEEAQLKRDQAIKHQQLNPTETLETLHNSQLTAHEKQKPIKLGHAEFLLFDSPPTEFITYEKQVQTVDEPLVVRHQESDPMTEKEPCCQQQPSQQHKVNVNSILHVNHIQETVDAPELSDSLNLHMMNEQESKAVIETREFQDFFQQSIKMVERAMAEPLDVLMDYGMSTNKSSLDPSMYLNELVVFKDDQWTHQMSVTDMDFSPQFSELVACSLKSNAKEQGRVLVWNRFLPNRPEYIFTTQSDITKLMFVDYSPHLIIGGSASGQVIVWDMRSKQTPVLKTPWTTSGHCFPIKGLKVIGSQNAFNIMSASNDGKICTWSLDMMNQPIETLELKHSNYSKLEHVPLTCMAFPSDETCTFWIGTSEGQLHQINRFERAGAKAGIDTLNTFEKHQALMSAADFHPLYPPLDCKDLLLTSSFDWTVKLWKVKTGHEFMNASMNIEPLYTFDDFEHYVHDVQWSPIHPAVFASIDGGGYLTCYNLNESLQPMFSQRISSHVLTRMKWHPSKQCLAIGDSQGQVALHELTRASFLMNRKK